MNLSKRYVSFMTVECEVCRSKFHDYAQLYIHKCTQTRLDEAAE